MKDSMTSVKTLYCLSIYHIHSLTASRSIFPPESMTATCLVPLKNVIHFIAHVNAAHIISCLWDYGTTVSALIITLLWQHLSPHFHHRVWTQTFCFLWMTNPDGRTAVSMLIITRYWGRLGLHFYHVVWCDIAYLWQKLSKGFVHQGCNTKLTQIPVRGTTVSSLIKTILWQHPRPHFHHRVWLPHSVSLEKYNQLYCSHQSYKHHFVFVGLWDYCLGIDHNHYLTAYKSTFPPQGMIVTFCVSWRTCYHSLC